MDFKLSLSFAKNANTCFKLGSLLAKKCSVQVVIHNTKKEEKKNNFKGTN